MYEIKNDWILMLTRSQFKRKTLSNIPWQWIGPNIFQQLKRGWAGIGIYTIVTNSGQSQVETHEERWQCNCRKYFSGRLILVFGGVILAFGSLI